MANYRKKLFNSLGFENRRVNKEILKVIEHIETDGKIGDSESHTDIYSKDRPSVIVNGEKFNIAYLKDLEDINSNESDIKYDIILNDVALNSIGEDKVFTESDIKNITELSCAELYDKIEDSITNNTLLSVALKRTFLYPEYNTLIQSECTTYKEYITNTEQWNCVKITGIDSVKVYDILIIIGKDKELIDCKVIFNNRINNEFTKEIESSQYNNVSFGIVGANNMYKYFIDEINKLTTKVTALTDEINKLKMSN